MIENLWFKAVCSSYHQLGTLYFSICNFCNILILYVSIKYSHRAQAFTTSSETCFTHFQTSLAPRLQGVWVQDYRVQFQKFLVQKDKHRNTHTFRYLKNLDMCMNTYKYMITYMYTCIKQIQYNP